MSKFGKNCGEELVDSAKFCKNCGINLETMEDNPYVKNVNQFKVESGENKHSFAVIIGYVCAVIMPLIGLIISIYLLTRDSENAKKHGKYVLIVTLIVWVLSVLSIFH